MSQPIPEDLRRKYEQCVQWRKSVNEDHGTRDGIPYPDSWEDQTVILIERIAALEAELREAKQECATLRATVARRSAPVSDEEAESLWKSRTGDGEGLCRTIRERATALIAARVKEPQ